MRYYIIAGEASGDLHASNLIRAIRNVDMHADFRGWGGDMMQTQGATIVKHYRDLAFMGFLEVITNLKTILSNLRFCKRDVLQYQPDVVILVDYPGFNLKIANFLHKKNIKVIYYISPQVWAWKQSRVKTIRKVVDKMLVILPFEKSFYAKHGMDVEFTGHPLLDALANRQPQNAVETDNRPLVALLPGSRKQEINKVLPLMMKTAAEMPDVNFAIAGVPSLGKEFYRHFIGEHNVQVVMNQTYNLLSQASAALVTSGTATLETALIGTPEVVCYKGGYLSYQIARRVVKVDYISLVNLIMKREVVKELIQDDLNVQNMKKELKVLLFDQQKRQSIERDYAELRRLLGGSGASAKAAEIIFNFLQTPDGHQQATI